MPNNKNSNNNIIEINNLSFSYKGSAPYILNNINLNIIKGSYLSILGENGSAKSTLLKLTLNLLKPSLGKINLNTDKIAYVPQKMESYNSQFPITVNEILKIHLKTLKLKDINLMNKALEQVNMLSYKNSLIGNLSGGQQQKIFIARALLGTPELLILDEPSTGIDIESQREIYKIIKHFNEHLGITVISVEHNLDAALNNSTHIYKMERGNGTLYTIKDYLDYLNKNEHSYAAIAQNND